MVDMNNMYTIALTAEELDILRDALECVIDWGDDGDGYDDMIALLDKLSEL